MVDLPWRRRRLQAYSDPRRQRRLERRKRRDDVADAGECCADVGSCDPCLLGLLTLGLAMWRSVPDHPDTPRGGLQRWLWRRIRAYQLYVSAHRPPRCPMTPTCSAYGLEAVRRHGALRGGVLVVRRLLRCGRTSRRVDPVPGA